MNTIPPAIIDSALCFSDSDSIRNQCFKRGWPSHLERAQERLTSNPGTIFLIGNSQAYGLEVTDAESYARLLAAKLNRPVFNLSLYGGRAPEYITLLSALKSKNKKSPLLVFIIGRENFDQRYYESPGGKPLDLASFQSDVKYLLDSDTTATLPAGFAPRYVTTGDRLEVLLGGHSLWPYRELPVDVLIDTLKHSAVGYKYLRSFGKDFKGYRWLPATNTYWERFKKRRRGVKAKAGSQTKLKGNINPKLQLPVVKRRDFTISDELLTMTMAALEGSAQRVVWLTMPVHSSLQKEQAGFHGKVAAEFAAPGIEFIDISAILADENFIGRSHLTPEGHKAMAATVAGLLKPVTDGSGP